MTLSKNSLWTPCWSQAFSIQQPGENLNVACFHCTYLYSHWVSFGSLVILNCIAVECRDWTRRFTSKRCKVAAVKLCPASLMSSSVIPVISGRGKVSLQVMKPSYPIVVVRLVWLVDQEWCHVKMVSPFPPSSTQAKMSMGGASPSLASHVRPVATSCPSMAHWLPPATFKIKF